MQAIAAKYPQDSSTQRQLWRKVQKGWYLNMAELNTFQNIQAAQKVQLEALQRSRKRPVEVDANDGLWIRDRSTAPRLGRGALRIVSS